ncbi:translocation/assembly module TamB domain-containing protein [Pelistega ratti]|uniref:translocation/assembly module TamB domain-containing protein n=1 Tax=Pelistega ratti TaxID=2652177 RepID=UPI00135B416E|nr:translocation/assembly module TamB domain-containing protein [Pelistega ratti]
MSGVQVEKFALKLSSVEVYIDNIDLKVQLQDLLTRTVYAKNLAVDNVEVRLLPSTEAKETVSSSSDTLFPQLPINLKADKVALGHFSLLQANAEALPITFSQLEANDFVWNQQVARLDLVNLNTHHKEADSQLKGYIEFSDITQNNLPLNIQLSTQHSTQNPQSFLCMSLPKPVTEMLDDASCALDLQIVAKGNLDALDLTLDGNGKDITIQGQTLLSLSDIIPVHTLQADIAIQNVANIKANAQLQKDSTANRQLVADIVVRQANLNGVMPKSQLNADIHLQANSPSTTQLDTLNTQVNIHDGSLWNGEVTKGTVDLGLDFKEVFSVENAQTLLENLHIHKADIDLSLGKNTLKTEGRLGHEDDIFSLKAQFPTLSTIYQGIGESASAEIYAKGALSKHQLNATVGYTPGKTQDFGSAPITVVLEMQNRLKNLLQDFQWDAEIVALNAQHKDYRLDLEDNLALSFQTGDMLKWSLGKTTFSLRPPQGKTANIVHYASSQEGDRITSSGEAQNITFEKSIYNATWDIQQQADLQAGITIHRQGEQTLGLQANPLANIRQLVVKANSTGQRYHLTAEGEGENTVIHAIVDANMDKPLVLDKADFNITLSDGTQLVGNAVIQPTENQQGDLIDIDLQAQKLVLNKWTTIPLVFNGKIKANAHLSQQQSLVDVKVNATVDEGSTWNKQKLQGKMDVLIKQKSPEVLTAQHYEPSEKLVTRFNPNLYHIEQLDTDIRLGQSLLFTKGSFGQEGDTLLLDVQLPKFADIDPILNGGLMAKGTLSGSMQNHLVDVSAEYALTGQVSAKSSDLIRASVKAEGGWQTLSDQKNGWSGRIQTLDGSYEGYQLNQQKTLDLTVIPMGENDLPEWKVGETIWRVYLTPKDFVDIQQLGSTGQNGQWTTKGAIHGFVFNQRLIDTLNKFMQATESNNGIVIRNQHKVSVPNLVFDVDWDLAFNKALKGTANIVRRSGDFIVPLQQQQLVLGLENLALHLTTEPKGAENSLIHAQLIVDTKEKGDAQLTLQSMLKGLNPDLKGGTQLSAKGGIKDIAWASVFTNDLLSLGGAVNFDLALKSTPQGKWVSSGFLNGEKLRIVEGENGVRLLNGTLEASFHDSTVRVNKLHFPGIIRVTPNEWRTRQWIEENPPAQNGSLDITAEWDIDKSKGFVKTVLDHYPIVQRSDRFAMMSGAVDMDIDLPKIKLDGKVTADAGWASIDISETAPSVDGDVIVLKPNQVQLDAAQSNTSNQLDMRLTVDLGPRFYLVGMGLNSGLIGAITLVQEKGRLTAEGQFRTRGGAIEAYGQRLQIARGEIDFSGNIANPSLNIEAIRRGQEVEAGLRVQGTAKKPKIVLVSYPDVSDVEKLSWLIMGRGPDSSGADLALLFSVGSSLIGGNSEPLYKRVGIDEIGVRSGGVGDTDNILPDRTVADSTAYKGSDEANQLFYATKKFGENWRVSVEQALTGTGTVVRGSYNLMKYLTVDLKFGTLNGLELVYRRIFKD